VDWRVYARTERLYVKEFTEETHCRFWVVCDTSGSMAYRGRSAWGSKFECAQLLAAALTLLMLRQNDAVGLLTLREDGVSRRFVWPSQKRHQFALMLCQLERLTAAGGGSRWPRCARVISNDSTRSWTRTASCSRPSRSLTASCARMRIPVADSGEVPGGAKAAEMNIAFFYPLVWLGALAIGVPIWLHLRRRAEQNLVRFSALRFLDDEAVVKRSPLRLQDVLLFLVRALAILLLVGAFAWPYYRTQFLMESHVYLLDNTLSHQANGAFGRARDRLIKEIKKRGPQTQVAVIELASQPRVISGFGDPPEAAVEALRRLEPSFQRGSYGAALQQADALLADALAPRKRLFIFSDHQENQWAEVLKSPIFLRNVEAVLPTSRQAEAPNLAVAKPQVQRTFAGNRTVVDLAFELFHQGEAKTATVTVKANGREIFSRPVDLAAQPKTFLLTAQWESDPWGEVAGEVSAAGEPDALAGDNRVFFSLPPVREGRVVLVARSPFLRTALSPDIMRGYWATRALEPARGGRPIGAAGLGPTPSRRCGTPGGRLAGPSRCGAARAGHSGGSTGAREAQEKERKSVVLLLDRSSSMSLEEGGTTRFRHALAFASKTLLPALKRAELSPREFLFAEDSIRADGAHQLAAATPDGKRTDLAGAIARTLADATDPPFAVIALTDGAANVDGENAHALSGLLESETPFVGIGFGSETELRTLLLRHAISPTVVSPNQEFNVSAQLEMWSGAEMPPFDLLLLRDGQLLQKKSVTAGKGQRLWMESFPIAEEKEGVFTYSAQLQPPAVEGLRCPDTQAVTHVRVVKGRDVRGLFAQGALTWNYKFIRLALSGDPAIKVTGLTRTSTRSVLHQDVESAGEPAGGSPSTALAGQVANLSHPEKSR